VGTSGSLEGKDTDRDEAKLMSDSIQYFALSFIVQIDISFVHSSCLSCFRELTLSHCYTIMQDRRLPEMPLYFLWLFVSVFPVTAEIRVELLEN